MYIGISSVSSLFAKDLILPVSGNYNLLPFNIIQSHPKFIVSLYQVEESISVQRHAPIQRGDRGSGPPLKNHKKIGFLSNTGEDSLKNHKATLYQASIQCWAIIGTPAKRHLNGFLWWADDGLLLVVLGSPHQLKKKTLAKLDPSEKTFWMGA